MAPSFINSWKMLRLKRQNRSLSVDLTIGMVIILVLIEGGLLYFIYQRQSHLFQKEIEFKAEDYVAKLSEVLAVPIWDFDDEQIAKIGRGFLQNDLVRQLRITNNQGNQILLLENEGSAGPLVGREAIIRYNQQTIGHVELSLSAASYFEELDWLRNTLIVVLVCSMIVLFIASGLLLRIFLRKPLKVLAHGMDRIAQGEFEHQAQNLSYIELTGIAERFGQMATRIKNREHALIDINQQLQKVNRQLRQRFQYEQLLAEMSTRAASETDFSRFVQDSLRRIGETFDNHWAGLYCHQDKDDHLSLRVEWSKESQRQRPSRIAIDGGDVGGEIIDKLLENQTVQLDNECIHFLGSTNAPPFDPKFNTLLACPLFVDRNFYGAILLGDAGDVDKWDSVKPLIETAVQIVVRYVESAQARELLKRSEERFREMAEMLPETIFEMDRGGLLTYVNRSGLERFGYSTADLGEGLMAVDMFAPFERTGLENNIQSVLNGKEARLTEYRALHKDGSSFPAMVSSGPIRKAQQITGVRGFVIDISEKKNLEERLRKANRMEAIGNLAAGVAHDLNNILSGLVGYPDLLLLDLPSESPMRLPIKTIKETGQKAAAVVQDLLTLARRNIAELQIVNLNTIVSRYLESPEYGQLKDIHPSIRMATRLADDLMNVRAASHHLAKSLMNLVVNAMEAMPAGGDLEVLTANCYVDKGIEGYETIPEGEYVVLSVNDSGIGISGGDIQNIFEPFYTKKRMGRSGTGLGMSVVWATVKDHGGFINVDSKEGKGTRIDLYFPATRDKIDPKPKRTPIEDYLGDETILVVDDIPEQRRIAAEMLKRLGYTVHTVSRGEAAIETIQRFNMDLVVLDMIMDPGIDGLETYQQILTISPGQKAIIASGFSETERVKEALNLGVCSYIKKPYTLEKLGMTVRAALDQGRGHPQQN